MRVVRDEADLVRALPLAQAEAEAAFGNGEVYLERFIDRPRHVEVQVLADDFGNVRPFGERDCSIQRRHQKLVEEAPAPNLPRRPEPPSSAPRSKAPRRWATPTPGRSSSSSTTSGNFYFMEMNTRIQVEHRSRR